HAEIYRAIAGATVADSRCHPIPLLVPSQSDHVNPGADSVAVAAPSLQPHRQPVIPPGRGISEQLRGFADPADHYIHTPVAIEIRESRSSMQSRFLEILAGSRTHIHKGSAVRSGQRQVRLPRRAVRELFHITVDRAAGRKQVFPTIIVEVKYAIT